MVSVSLQFAVQARFSFRFLGEFLLDSLPRTSVVKVGGKTEKGEQEKILVSVTVEESRDLEEAS